MKRIAATTSALAIIALASVAWFAHGPARVPANAPAPAAARHLTVATTAVISRLTITGTVGAGKTVPVVAPFDGAVRERRMRLGDRVAAGDVLLVMDDAEVQSRLREAQATLLKATMAVDVLNRWDAGPEVMRARRTLETAEAALGALERKVAETKILLNRGIVSRNEYDGLVQQRDAQGVTVAGSRQDLQTTLDRGNADSRQLADLDLKNAQARLADLQQQVDGRAILAAAAGILTRPPVSGQTGQAPVTIEPGTRIARGQPIYAIADTATLVVVGKIDEVDVNRVRIGQAVKITSDAFSTESIGRIVGVSAEADSGQGASRAPSFEVRATIAGDGGAGRETIRIGMSARMTIELRDNPHSIVVPVEAIRDAASRPTVRVRDPQSGRERDQPVVLGATNENGVEILKGLEVGDVVIIQ